MSKWYEFHIKNEIVFWFIMVSIIPLIGLFSANYFLQKNQFKSQAKEHLVLVLNEKISKLQTQIDDFEKTLKLAASYPNIVDGFLKTKNGFAQNKNDTTTHEELNKMFELFIDRDKFYDIFFIDLDGNIIYTKNKESDFGTNLEHGAYKNTNLAKAYRDAKMFLKSQISTFEYYSPSNAHAAFIAHPIYFDSKIVGVLAMQLNKDRFWEIFSDQRGLGSSGEFFAATKNTQNKILSTTNLKYIPNSIENEFEFDSNKRLASTKAVLGENGSGETIDYRGKDVISAWGYIPSLNWGVVVKIDADEVLEPIHKIEFISIIVLFFVLVFIAIAIIMATRHIVTPIDLLTKRVKKFSIGGLNTPINEQIEPIVNNEIGVLAKNFNEMATNLRDSQEVIKKYANELEEKVKERTKELEDAKNELFEINASMKRYLDIIDRYVITSSTDLNGVIQEASSAFCDITGYTKDELVGKKHNIVRHPSMSNDVYKEIWTALKENRTWNGEIKNLRKNGTSYWVYTIISPLYNSSGEKIGYTSVRQDISNQKIIEELSITDPLTQLYNRLKLEEVFKLEIQRADRYKIPFSVILLDIDHFKSVNDTYGHDIGDKTLIDVAKIIKSRSRTTDIAGRWGGEEFMLIMPQTDTNAAFEHAQKLREAIEQHHFEVVGTKTSSFGVSSFTSGDTSKTVVKRADDALYDAKKGGRNRVCTR